MAITTRDTGPARSVRLRRVAVMAACTSVVVVVAAACGSSGGTTTKPSSQPAGISIPASINTYNANPSGAKVPGGTVYWAQAPAGAPNYIFPMTSAQVCGTDNVEYLSAMLYRPLYWFGNNLSAPVDYNYSIGQAPVWNSSDNQVTIHLNNWKWSDGEQVTSRDVELWVNVYKANPAANYCGYVPPASTGEKFFPDNVASMSLPNATTITFNLTQSYNPTWYLYNELSQITPLPLSWDRTSLSQPAPTTDSASLPDSTTAGAESVYKFLNAQSENTGSWASSPLWTVVDGPFKLTSFTTQGQVTMVPNPDYSGSPKPSIAKFVELPFTDNNAELTALKTDGPGSLTVGYLPPEDATQQSSLQSEGYAPQAAYTFSYGFFPLNLNNPKFGPVFRQAYFRQAFQHLVDQPAWTTAYLNGWGYPTSGPVPLEPPNTEASSLAKTNPFPFSLADAQTILSDHGWKTVGGVATCESPGSGPTNCGPGVPSGLALSFNLDYASGTPSIENEVTDLAAQAARVGIKLRITTHNFNTVIGTAVNCTPSQAVCNWTAEDWGGGWVYAPDFLPTGEELFFTGAAANYENYNDPTANSLILRTTTAPQAQSQAALTAYQNYIIEQAPVVWIPTQLGNPIPGGPAIISAKLGGVVPNTYSYITPEAWYFTK